MPLRWKMKNEKKVKVPKTSNKWYFGSFKAHWSAYMVEPISHYLKFDFNVRATTENL